MDFMEAVKAMKEGKKVRLSSYDEGTYRHIMNGVIAIEEAPSMSVTGDDALDLDEYEATDWEIYLEHDG